MSLPDWFTPDGQSLVLHTEDESDGRWQLARLFQIVTPWKAGEAVPVSVERTVAGAAGGQTIFGTGAFWGSEQARFGISVRDSSAAGGPQRAPTGAWVAKPVRLIGDVVGKLPGMKTDTFWMVLSATVMEDPWSPEAGQPPMLPMSRHLAGVVEIAGKPVLTRLTFLGDTVTAQVDFAGELTEVEAAAMGHPTGDLHSHALTFADLAGLFGNEHDPHADLEWLPEALQSPIRSLATGVGLKDVHFTVDPEDDDKLVAAGAIVSLGGSAAWRIIPDFDFLTVGDVEVAFDVDHPLDAGARFPHVEVSGVIRLGVTDESVTPKKYPAEIGIEARWPDLAITGQLRRGHEHSRERDNPTPDEHPIYVKDLLEALHLPAITHGAGPAVSYLSFRARPSGRQKSFEIHGTVDEVLSIPVGGAALEVRQVEMALALERGEERSLAARIAGQLALVPPGATEPATSLLLSAETDHGTDGWMLSGRMAGKAITVADLEAWLAPRFGAQALPKGALADHSAGLEEFSLTFHTASRDTKLHVAAGLQLGAAASAPKGTLALDVALSHHGGDHFETRVGGELTIESAEQSHIFELLFAKDSDSTAGAGPTATELLVAAYRNPGDTTVGDLLAAIGLDLPVPIVLSDALIAHGEGRFLCFADMGVGFDLSRLPFVGKLLPTGQDLSLAMRIHGATGEAWGVDEVTALNGALPGGFAPVDVPDTGEWLPRAGLHLALDIGGESLTLDLGLGLSDRATKAPGGASPSPNELPVSSPTADEGVQWVPIQRKLGPVHLRRVGAQYRSETSTGPASIELALDGDLSLGGLTLSLQGLTVSSPLADPTREFRPTFGLRGLGLDVKQGSVEIGGALLMTGPDEFAGAAVVRTDKLSLSALGSFGRVGGSTSLFVYAVLDYPLGGPSFFFVTGLAAGFGYNRKLLMPEPDRITDFPLVVEAMGGAADAGSPTGDSLTAKLATLADHVPYSPGDMFFAAGIRFTSFQQIDSFVLLIVSAGSQFRLDVLGKSTLVAPAPDEGGKDTSPVAEVHVALHAQFVPDEGFLGVDARLTPASYLLSNKCHIEGGFAFYSWFSGPHAGDFVITMGGYHPDFKAPAHYPTVPRLRYVWQVSEQVAIKGDAYYAMTGHVLMAGGSLNATYDSGDFHAWFRMGVDFLIAWQPYLYDAHAHVSVGARWHFIEAELGVDLHVWGPEFAGRGEVDLTLTSFTIEFGAAAAPPASFIDWDRFRSAFLPDENALCTIACQTGLMRQLEPAAGTDVEWVVSGHDLVIAMASQVPSTAATINGLAPKSATDLAWNGAEWSLSKPIGSLGAGPMNIGLGELKSTFQVTVVDEAGPTSDVFRLEPILKRVPTSMWGAPDPGPRAGRAEDAWVEDALAGFELRPKPHSAPSVSEEIPKTDLGYSDHLVAPTVDTPPWGAMTIDGGKTEAKPAEDAAADRNIATARAALLRGLGIDPGTVRPGPGLEEAYLFPPRRGRILDTRMTA